MNLDRFFKCLTMTMVLAFGLLACATTKPMTQKPSLVSALAPAPASALASTVSAAPTSDNLQGTTLVTSQATDVTNAASAISASNSALKTAPILPSMPPPKGYSKGVKAYLAGDFKQALAVWTPVAEQGYAEAQYNLGHMYRKGQGVTQNESTAIKWYILAAEQGEPGAQFNAGLMYQYGEGVAPNNAAAVKWLTLAAEQGHTFAQYNLGIIYARGKGDLTDYERAYMWSNLSANNKKTSGDKIKHLLGGIMTASQISKAEEMSSRCLNSDYTDC